MTEFCRHFHGVHLSNTCDAGVMYDTVRVSSAPMPGSTLPCFDPDARHACSRFAAHTPEEIEETDRALADALTRLDNFSARQSEDCPQCGTHVERIEQVGRCVYTQPCGCRLWQGKIPEAWR